MIEVVRIVLISLMTKAVLSSDVKIISDRNFSVCLQGEWMLEFYAPWCPACKQFATTWRTFAESSSSRNIAMIDVTQNSVTAGRFMIMALPTIMHVNDGVARPYQGARNLQGLQQFVDEQLWRNVEPLPWYSQPASIQMFLVGYIYWASQRLTEIQHELMEEYELSPVTIVIIVGVVTVLVGCICGGVLIGLSVGWNRFRAVPLPSQQEQSSQQQQTPDKTGKDEEEEEAKEVTNKKNEGEESELRKRANKVDDEQ